MLRTQLVSSMLLMSMMLPGLAFGGGDAVKGKEIYTKFCASCHGPSGRGDGPAAAALNPKPRNFADKKVMDALTDDYLFKVIQGGGAAVGKSPMMPPWGGALKEADIHDVTAYVRTLVKK
ncbi:MAG: cytochrome c [candidate division NC10 bacterium]|nr:cytochrome c [candidate division NC10 bacterium]